MAAREANSLKLRFGPYPAPRTRRDGKLFCEIRGTVTVGGYSDGPIPWPRIKKGGGHCLILCGSLVKAVKREALLTVAHHWGVSQTTVWQWRRALNVPRWNEGSTELAREWEAGRDDDRLVRARMKSREPAAIQQIAATLRGRPPSPATIRGATAAAKRPRSAGWCEKISRLWKERGHRPPPHPDRRPWTGDEDALVGTDRNEIIAVRLGRSATAVELRRLVLGIPGRLTPLDPQSLLRLRVRRGWNRRELADRAAVRYLDLWRIETGRRLRVDRDVADRLAAALGVERSEIVRPNAEGI